MACMQDPFAPDPKQVLCSPSEPNIREALCALLDQIPDTFLKSLPADVKAASGCAGSAAIIACIELMKDNGGKLHVFATELPNVGIKRLQRRDTDFNTKPNTQEEQKQSILATADLTFKSAAIHAAEHQVCIDLALLTQGYADTATQKDWVQTTGGSLYRYHPFDPQLDHEQVVNDLLWNVRRAQGLEAMLRVRCSQGLDVTGYFGAYMARETDVALAGIDCDKALVVTLRHEEKLTKDTEAFLQAALLYSTVTGERRIRVHTIALPIVTQAGAVFRGADLDSVFQTITSRVVWELPATTLEKQREKLQSTTMGILHAYRKHCASNSSPGQLILPESLKLLPLYCISYIKSAALLSTSTPDDRAAALFQQSVSTTQRFMASVIPRMVNLLDVDKNADGVWAPRTYLMLSSSELNARGIFLIHNGLKAYIYIGQQAPDDAVQQLMGCENVAALSQSPSALILPRLNTPLSDAANHILDAARSWHSSYMRLRIVVPKSPYEREFANAVVEDQTQGGMSYIEFLCFVHKRIQDMDSDR